MERRARPLTADQARSTLAEHYPVEFPPELLTLWELARSLAPEHPSQAFGDSFCLVGPFDLLGGQRPPAALEVPLLMHWRYYMDPPELFTVATGHTDGQHWGYWFDAPGERRPVVCSYFNNDAYELRPCDSLLEALEEQLEWDRQTLEEYRATDPAGKAHYEGELERLAELRRRMSEWAWPTTAPTPARRTNVPTFGGMDLIVPAPQATGLLQADALHERADRGDGAELLEEARAALAAGKLGLALQLARAVWALAGSRESHPDAALVLAEVYDALGRPALAQVARAQARHRSHPSVDLL